MAFEQLEPYRAEIIQLRTPGPGRLTFSKLAEHLYAKYQLRTTPATLCRYVKQLSPELAPRETTEAEEEQIDQAMLYAELFAEIRGRNEEQRRALEYLGGQMRVVTEMLAAMEHQSEEAASAIDPQIIRRIWLRAFLVCSILAGIIAAIGAGIILHTAS